MPRLLPKMLAALAIAFATGAPARTLDPIEFHIKKGHHGASNDFPGPHGLKVGKKHERKLRFKVLFPQSAAYKTANASNQSDANKVMGISTGRIHHNSVRLGWAWNPATSKMTLRFYGYLKGSRALDVLGEVPLEQWIDVEMGMSGGGMFVRANNWRIEKKQDLGFNGVTSTVILKTAYFGGDEKAPQDIRVKVKDIQFD